MNDPMLAIRIASSPFDCPDNPVNSETPNDRFKSDSGAHCPHRNGSGYRSALRLGATLGVAFGCLTLAACQASSSGVESASASSTSAPSADPTATKDISIVPAAIDPTAPTLVVEIGVHSAPVRRIALLPRLGLVVTTSDDKSARAWSLDGGTLKSALRPPVAYGRKGVLYGAAANPIDDIVAIAGSTGDESGGHLIMLIDAQTGSLQGSFDALAGDVRNLAWSTDGSLLFAVYAGDHGVRAFDRQGRLRYHQRFAQPAFGLSIASGLVAAGATDGQAVVLSASQGEVALKSQFQRKGKRLIALELSPDAQRLAISHDQSNAPPEIVSPVDGRLIRELKMPPRRVQQSSRTSSGLAAPLAPMMSPCSSSSTPALAARH